MTIGVHSSASSSTSYVKHRAVMYKEKNKNKICTISKYTKVKKISTFKNWTSIIYDGHIGFVKTSCLTNKKPYKSKPVPTNSFKSYMSYKAITNRDSPQYKLQKNATTGKYGIRTVNGRYCIALGSFYSTQVGAKVDLVMQNGSVIKCILGDCKANQHTDSLNQKTTNGCISEFIVDIQKMNKKAKYMGDMSYCCKAFKGKIKRIKIYNY